LEAIYCYLWKGHTYVPYKFIFTKTSDMKFIYALLYAIFNGKLQQLPVYNLSNQKRYYGKLFLPIWGILVLAVSLPQIGLAQQNNFTTGGNMLTGANYSLGLPNNTQDVLLTTPNDSLFISTTALFMQSLNVTNAGKSYYIGDSSLTNTGSLTIGNSAGFSNTIAGASANDLFYLANNSSLTIKSSIYSGTKALTLTLGSGGNFDIQSGSTLSIKAAFAGANHPITINGGGIVNFLNTTSTNVGKITINSGVCSIVNGSITAATTFNLNGGVLQANGGAVTTAAGNGITLGGGVFDNNNNIFTIKGGLSGTDLTSIGTGTLALGMFAANNTYSGNTYIQQGILKTTILNVLPITSVVYFGQASSANVGSLDVDATAQSIAGLVSVTGTNITGSINNTIINSSTGTPVIKINGNGTYTFGNNTPQNSGVISGGVGLNMSGTGLQILGGVNAYSGATTFSNGELRFVLPSLSSQSLGAANFSKGALGTTGSASGSSLTFSSIILNTADSSIIRLDPNAAHTVRFTAVGTFGSGALLTITGWQGGYNGTAGTAGRIFVGSTLTVANLSKIQFINPSTGSVYAATQITGTGEIVPIGAISLTIGSISGSSFCQGASAIVSFMYTPSSSFTSGSTTFTAYLSSATGSFASPTMLQSVISDGSGRQNVTVTIPATATLGTLYRIEIKSSGAIVLTSPKNINNLTVTANNWTGGISTDWNTPSNWCSGTVPVSGSSVAIPGALSNYPNITATSYVNNLTINSGGSITVASGGTLSIYGTIINNGALTATAGTIKMSGSLAQAIGGSMFTSSTINNLIDSNINAGGLTINAGDPVSITGQLSFGYATAALTTNNGLVLVSNASTTATVGQIAENGSGVAQATINGNITVQRYYPAHRRWRLVTAPIKSSGAPTISAAWQEGGQSIAGSVSNPNPGFGTHISGPAVGAFVASTGYDQSATNSPSIAHPMAANDWYSVANTTSTLITKYQGYMLFARGDRSFPVYTGLSNTPATSTILRTTGALNVGRVTVPVNSGFTVVGNPYAATINFNNVYSHAATAGAVTSNSFSLWDPNIGSAANVASGTGGWVTLSWNGTSYDASPNPFLFDGFDVNGDIQSGAAFIVNGSGSGSVEIDESDKVTDGTDNDLYLFRPTTNTTLSQPVTPAVMLRTTLYATDTAHVQTYLADGALNVFGSSYSDSLDWSKDVQKLLNLTERFSILKSGQNLAIEKSALPQAGDTVYFNVASLQKAPYQLVIATKNFTRPDIKAFLVDAFNSTSTPILLGDTSVNVNFTVTTVPGSYAANRFSIVFTATPPATVTYSSVTATAVHNKNIAVQWQVTNQTNTKDYVVERSTDGTHFMVIDTTAATPTDVASYTYNWTDTNAVVGSNYYRIYTIGDNFAIQDTSNVASAVIDAGIIAPPVATAVSFVKVYPNPVTNGTVNVDLTNLPAGNYKIKIISTEGAVLLSETTYHGANDGPITIPFGQGVSAGVYILEIIDTNGNKTKVTFENQ